MGGRRIALNRLQNDIRAILWSQGETDGFEGTSIAIWKSEFLTLRKSWLQDYPNVGSHIYMIQTKVGVYPINNLMKVMEAQRELASENPDSIRIMPTSALKDDNAHLHFDYINGYKEFGNRAYNLIAYDLYNQMRTQEIDAPMITDAYLSDSTTLVLVEKTNSLIAHTNGAMLGYEMENSKKARISQIGIDGNKIICKLSAFPGNNATVSYLGQVQKGTNWISNTSGIELLCFYKFPVKSAFKEVFVNRNSHNSASVKIQER